MPYPNNTISVEHMDVMHEGGARTEVADWVIKLDLAPESYLVYLRMCRMARIEDSMGVQFHFDVADPEWGHADTPAALDELVGVGAVTEIGVNVDTGIPVYEIEVYSPEVRALRAKYRQTSGMPIVSYG
jgi:hypothetical protein